MRRNILNVGGVSLILIGLMVGSLPGAITTEQKKELKEIGADVAKIASMISKKKYDDAATAIDNAEERIATFIKEAGIKDTDPVLKLVHSQVEKAKKQLTKATGKGGVSFEKSVAPILAGKCVGCHGDDPKGSLNLNTFAGLKSGGKSGDVVVPGNPENSLLLGRIVTQDESLRMPKGKEALMEKEIQAIYAWISEGAKFEGDEKASMAALSKAAASGKPGAGGKAGGAPAKPVIQKETGNETVHFTRDLMPELVDTCGRCHNDTTKRAGFSVVSFEKLMRGGDSGAVIVGGKLEDSRLWRLINGPDQGTPVMPAGNQTGITRKWYDNMKTWILEGARYDGTDATRKFPTFEERQAMARAGFSPEQWLDLRKKATEGEWKKTFPSAEPKRRESTEFLLLGDVTDDRLEQVEKWASEHAGSLRQTFKVKDEPLWKGKLGIFVFKERFGYEEFNNSVHRREVPREVIGHSQVNAEMTDAFIAVQDVGDAPTETSPGMQVNLIDQLTGAFLKRGGSNLPDWLIRGTGLALASHKSPNNPFLSTMPRLAGGILQESKVADPDMLFADGTFAPGEVAPIGFTLVDYLMKQRGGAVPLGLLIQKIQSGSKPAAAIKDVYQIDSKALAGAYADSLPSGGIKKGKKK